MKPLATPEGAIPDISDALSDLIAEHPVNQIAYLSGVSGQAVFSWNATTKKIPNGNTLLRLMRAFPSLRERLLSGVESEAAA